MKTALLLDQVGYQFSAYTLNWITIESKNTDRRCMTMSEQWSIYASPSAEIPFTLRDYPGILRVYYGVNTDAVKAGFDFLGGLNFNPDFCKGYPVVHARIEDYAGSGYRTVCAWIQVVTRVDIDSHDAAANAVITASLDIAPAFEGLGLPFVCLGNLPQFFDAPCHNLNASAELRWTADTFLTTMPMRSRDEAIQCLASFRWGYDENDLPGTLPVQHPLEVTSGDAWNHHLPFLRGEFPGWTFQDA